MFAAVFGDRPDVETAARLRFGATNRAQSRVGCELVPEGRGGGTTPTCD